MQIVCARRFGVSLRLLDHCGGEIDAEHLDRKSVPAAKFVQEQGKVSCARADVEHTEGLAVRYGLRSAEHRTLEFGEPKLSLGALQFKGPRGGEAFGAAVPIAADAFGENGVARGGRCS